jgi:protein O-mannosyl-transferase
MWPFGRRKKRTRGGPEDERQERFVEATQAIEDGRLAEGIEFLEELVEDHPDYASARVNLGAVYYATERHAEAVTQFEAAHSLKPDDPRILLNLAAAKSALSELDQSIDLLIKALEIDPEFRDVHYNLGIAYWRKGRAPEAIAELEMELALHQDHEAARETIERIKAEAGMDEGDLLPPSGAADR